MTSRVPHNNARRRCRRRSRLITGTPLPPPPPLRHHPTAAAMDPEARRRACEEFHAKLSRDTGADLTADDCAGLLDTTFKSQTEVGPGRHCSPRNSRNDGSKPVGRRSERAEMTDPRVHVYMEAPDCPPCEVARNICQGSENRAVSRSLFRATPGNSTRAWGMRSRTTSCCSGTRTASRSRGGASTR